MTIEALIFDIGGVLENTPDLGVTAHWERRLGLAPGDLDRRMADAWRAGSVGAITEADVATALEMRLGLAVEQRDAFLADMWREYLGTANTELIDFVRGLRPRYRTGIISNSFVGARGREQAAYGFEDLVDDIVYSHEVGLQKPDPRIYRLASERLRVAPASVLFVDDREAAVQGARDVGMHGLLHAGDTAETIRLIRASLPPS